MRPGLSPDQRHLLAFVGRSNGTMLLDALIDEHARRALFGRAGGASGPAAPDGAPAWMTSYWTEGRRFVSPWRTGAPIRVAVTESQITRLGADLSAALRQEIRALLDRQRAERNRTLPWCHCPWRHHAPNAHSGPCTRYHPTDDEDDEHRRREHELRDWADALLHRALDLDAGDQLDLFGALT